MRYIPTTNEKVEQLRKQAKQLQRKLGGKHTQILDQVAKRAKYDHWHHVIECHGRSKCATGMVLLRKECERIIAAELDGIVEIMTVGAEFNVGPFVVFSTGLGDAWMLDPSEQTFMCLVLDRKRFEPKIHVEPLAMSVTFDGVYELTGDFFRVESPDPMFDRAFGGYPLTQLREALEPLKPNDIKIAETIIQFDTVEMSPDVIAQMMKKGYSETELLQMKAEGFRYSPSRDTLLTPIFTEEDFEDSDQDEIF